ncbi:Nuclear receptor 2C2-associated protein [Aphanomyces cochlioides]|nr:Nuclear receptor 2C2-associated protein [Aphanomyces cochlioides]
MDQLLSGDKTSTTCRVSSVLNRDRKEYGAHHMFDGSEISCWNSAEGSPQQVWLDFHRTVHLRRVQVMFQGGFVGEDVQFLVTTTEEQTFHALPLSVHFDDGNAMQSVDVACDNVTQLRLHFGRSSDFYGRVTIYQLLVWGEETNA